MAEAQIYDMNNYREPREGTSFGDNDEVHLHKADSRLMSIDAARKVVAGSFDSTEQHVVVSEQSLSPEQAEHGRRYVDAAGLGIDQARQAKLTA